MSDSMPRKSLSWLWFFAGLVLLTLLALGVSAYFNVKQQLKREQLDRAIQRWAEVGPKSYRMKYVQKLRDELEERFEVVVLGGKVSKVLRNDVPLARDQFEYYTMDNKLAELDRFMFIDEKEKQRVYLRGYFDPETGRLISYTRHVLGKNERVHIEVKEFAEEKPPG